MAAPTPSHFRDTPGSRVKWLDTRTEVGFSNFLFIDQYYGSDPVLRRIFSQARKLGYHSLLIDAISEDTCGLLAAENTALRLRCPDFRKSDVHRFAFFKCPPDQTPAAGDFLGYAVFKTDYGVGGSQLIRHVYESVMPPARQSGANNFIHCLRHYSVCTSAGNFSVTGSLYAQQNDSTFVCAHVALRSALACWNPSGDVTYETMNTLAGVDHGDPKRQLGNGKGLSPGQVETILSKLGISFGKLVHEPTQSLVPLIDFTRELYGYIESGWPALLAFELKGPKPSRHMIPVIGHTFNEDTWVPEAERAYFGGSLGYYPSESWLSTYVIHDDNFGPYFCIPRRFLESAQFRLLYGFRSPLIASSAVDMEAVGLDLFHAIVQQIPNLGNDWYDRFAIYTKTNVLTLRTVSVSRNDYKGHLTGLSSVNGDQLEAGLQAQIIANLPERFWIVEASSPELFSASRRKFGEIVLADNQPQQKAFLALRLPGLVAVIDKTGKIQVQKSTLQGHTNLFAFNSACAHHP